MHRLAPIGADEDGGDVMRLRGLFYHARGGAQAAVELLRPVRHFRGQALIEFDPTAPDAAVERIWRG